MTNTNVNTSKVFVIGIAEFLKIPGNPIAYWISENQVRAFEIGKPVDSIANVPKGLSTGCVDLFMRYWHEIAREKIDFDSHSCQESKQRRRKWFPYAKGGAFRRWNGNMECVVNWKDDGFEVKNFVDEKGKQRSRPQNTSYYFKKCLTYSAITGYKYSLRYCDRAIFGGGGDAIHTSEDHFLFILGFMNSCIAQNFLRIISPTLNFEVDHIKKLPIIEDQSQKAIIEKEVEANITLSDNDWNSFETSWGFKKHPLL